MKIALSITQKSLIGLVLISTLSGCLSTPINESEFSPVAANSTYLTQELSCVGDNIDLQGVKPEQKFSIAVGSIVDRTGKYDQLGSGSQVTQGAADIATTALYNTNAFRVSERVDVGVHSFELNYASQGMIRRAEYTENGERKRILRNNKQGDVVGTDFYLAGAITEVNYNISSGGYEADLNGLEHGKRVFTMSIALDLRLVNTTSLEISDAVSVKKVVKGYETKWGLFDFMDNYLIDISGGEKVQEPLQLGVRAAIEQGVIELSSRAYGLNNLGNEYSCSTITSNIVRFDFDEYKTMSKEYKLGLDKTALYLVENPDLLVKLTGHADSVGTNTYNSSLGLKRASRIKDYLILKGVDGNRILTDSAGEEKPYSGISIPPYHYLDRRVEIKIINT